MALESTSVGALMRYHTADSGRLPTQHLTRKGDKHNMESNPKIEMKLHAIFLLDLSRPMEDFT